MTPMALRTGHTLHVAGSDGTGAAFKQTYRDRVLRVFIVTDDVPPWFVDWVER